ncbi:MAG: 4Fe-4S binding protein [Clostridia bacterium]|nr:4Fe-4S binding protein [Clostridia bacterium]
MDKIIHSVTLDTDKCKGCTNCIKMCPTQAIRVRKNKAKIIKELCIDCGECIRVCPYHAKKAVTDSFDMINNYKYKIALPAPAFYGQFDKATKIESILHALIKAGFDDVFEVAYAAQLITKRTKELIASGELETPIINSACPAVVNLISTKYPSLLNNVIPLISPMNLAAIMARKIAEEKTPYKGGEIGIFFITPCAAKATCTKYPLGLPESVIDGAFSFKDMYLKVVPHLNDKECEQDLSKAGFKGVCWANCGGEVVSLELDNYIAVDGIHNVIHVLEEIENDKLSDVEYVEALACTGGCVGGPLAVENNFVAQTRVKKMAKTARGNGEAPEFDMDLVWQTPIKIRKQRNLDDDMFVAMEKLAKIDEIYDRLPKLDCGSCGSPSCRALAEDIVRGYSKESDCIIKFKEKIALFANEMLDGSDNVE